MLTLGQIQNSTLVNVAGCAPTSQQFINYVNDATRVLMDLGSWWGTVFSMCGSCFNGCMTWPRKVDAVLAFNVCNYPITLANYWYSYIPMEGRFAGLIQNREWCGFWNKGNHNTVLEFAGTQPLFYSPSPADQFDIQFTCDNASDYGKTVTIYGLDSNGKDVVTTRTDGSVQRGIVVTLSASNPVTGIIWSHITHATKDITAANVNVFRYNPSALFGTMCGIWGAAQITPEFLFSRIPGCPQNQRQFSIHALVKLGFEPVSKPSDIVPIGNLDAIKTMVQSIRKREAGDEPGGILLEKSAIRRMNKELKTRFPHEQFVMAFRPFGDDNLNNSRVYAQMM
jgi:hypothetical protein